MWFHMHAQVGWDWLLLEISFSFWEVKTICFDQGVYPCDFEYFFTEVFSTDLHELAREVGPSWDDNHLATRSQCKWWLNVALIWGNPPKKLQHEWLWMNMTFYDLIIPYSSSTAQGGGGSFKNRKRIGEIDCCEWGMSEQKHWPTD